MALLLISFVAGMLTVLAPCILPVLPVIIGGAAQDGVRRNPYVITGALAGSIVVFTLLLKFSTAFITVPQAFWSGLSGGILILFGVTSIWPGLWEKVSLRLGLQSTTEKFLSRSAQKSGVAGDVLLGTALGPVFSSCSPVYFVILATVLPQQFFVGVVYLIAYALGLAFVLLAVSLLGQKFVRKIGFATDPRGWFKRGLGVVFLLVGVFVASGADKKVQTFLLEKGYYNVTNLEQRLLEFGTKMDDPVQNDDEFPRYQEIRSPSGFVNTDGVTLGELVGKKVVLVDFMTYSCINCIRTFPYLNDWYAKYKDAGLEIVGIHTPEFAFEKDRENVVKALADYGIQFPVVMDNEYATWNAWGNRYWPRKYLIDLEGRVVYDHIGEGGYAETEKKIQELLGISGKITDASDEKEVNFAPVSPEMYFGSLRNSYLVGAVTGYAVQQIFTVPDTMRVDRYALGGEWSIAPEYAEAVSADARIVLRFRSESVYLVASAEEMVFPKVYLDGKQIDVANFGWDIEGPVSRLPVEEEKLYSLYRGGESGTEHVLELVMDKPGMRAFAFTFGE